MSLFPRNIRQSIITALQASGIYVSPHVYSELYRDIENLRRQIENLENDIRENQISWESFGVPGDSAAIVRDYSEEEA